MKISFVCTRSSEDLVFTRGLADLLYNHNTEEMKFQIEPEPKRRSTRFLAVRIHADVQNKVRTLLELMFWWWNTQVDSYCQRAILTLPGARSLAEQQLPEPSVTAAESEEPEQDQTERNQTFVSALVQILIGLSFNKRKMKPENTRVILRTSV